MVSTERNARNERNARIDTASVFAFWPLDRLRPLRLSRTSLLALRALLSMETELNDFAALWQNNDDSGDGGDDRRRVSRLPTSAASSYRCCVLAGGGVTQQYLMMSPSARRRRTDVGRTKGRTAGMTNEQLTSDGDDLPTKDCRLTD